MGRREAWVERGKRYVWGCGGLEQLRPTIEWHLCDIIPKCANKNILYYLEITVSVVNLAEKVGTNDFAAGEVR